MHVYTCVAQERKMGIPAWGEALALSEPLAHQGHGDLKQGAAGSGREQTLHFCLAGGQQQTRNAITLWFQHESDRRVQAVPHSYCL